VFEVLEEEIARARSSVHLLTYMWHPGRASERVISSLMRKAAAGVACRIAFDAMGSRGRERKALHRRLLDAGCETRVFRPLLWRSPESLLLRTHRKILVVDGCTALTGGWCIRDEWLGDGRTRTEWRDSNLRIRGPVVAMLQQAFQESWKVANGGDLLPADCWPRLDAAGGDLAGFLATGATNGRTGELLVDHLVTAARRRLWIANGYFVPDERLVESLAERAHAGVDVRILVPGPVHDLPHVRRLQRLSYGRLLESKVRLWEYQPAMLHSKSIVMDGYLCVVGSMNLEPFSLRVLEEGTLVALAPELARAMERSFLEDLRFSREISHPGFRGSRSRLWHVGVVVRHLGYRAARALSRWKSQGDAWGLPRD